MDASRTDSQPNRVHGTLDYDGEALAVESMSSSIGGIIKTRD